MLHYQNFAISPSQRTLGFWAAEMSNTSLPEDNANENHQITDEDKQMIQCIAEQ